MKVKTVVKKKKKGFDLMAKQVNKELIKVSMNLPMSIVERVKSYAETLGINITSAYIVLLNQALDQKDAMNNLPAMFTMMNQLQNFGDKLDKTNTDLTSSK